MRTWHPEKGYVETTSINTFTANNVKTNESIISHWPTPQTP